MSWNDELHVDAWTKDEVAGRVYGTQDEYYAQQPFKQQRNYQNNVISTSFFASQVEPGPATIQQSTAISTMKKGPRISLAEDV
jgi:hypothetical protein